jgi:hypothetical protein
VRGLRKLGGFGAAQPDGRRLPQEARPSRGAVFERRRGGLLVQAECFAADVACTSTCKCLDCGNLEAYSADRQRKRQKHSEVLKVLEEKRRAPLGQLESTKGTTTHAEETPRTVTTPKTSLESEEPKPVTHERPVTPPNAGQGEHTTGADDVVATTASLVLTQMDVIGGPQATALLIEALRNATA